MIKRTVLLAGATGLIGNSILDGLLADESVESVHVLARRSIARVESKITVHVVDFGAIPPLPLIDEAYLALGTTLSSAGSQAAFRAVDYDANLATARAALASGAKHIGVISAMGANPRSRVFYSRTKGELEDAISELPFDGVIFVRPSLLLGNRAVLGQPPRAGERFSAIVGKILGPLIPANYRPVYVREVARSLLNEVPNSTGRRIITSSAMRSSSSKDSPGRKSCDADGPSHSAKRCPGRGNGSGH